MKRQWWKEAVCYQVYPRSFKDSNGDGIGDINGITEKLDYLKALGIDVIWVSPIYDSPNDDNGYDISDYQNIMSDFGTMEDFDRLLLETHQRGMKLIMDLVINHTSDEHPWFIEAKTSENSAYRDWYIWQDSKEGKEPNNWASIFEGSAWEYEPISEQYYFHTFSRKQPDLNWDNQEMRYAIYNMINWWLNKGIDGFRVDAISHIKKSFDKGDIENPEGLDYVQSFTRHMNQPGIQTYLEELKRETFEKYDIMTVGEANGVTIEDSNEWVGEEDGKFNMVFQFEHLKLWEVHDKKLNILKYKDVLNNWQVGLHNSGWNALFIENHDRPRIPSTWGSEDYRMESATAHGAVYFLQQGTPFIYQGQEIGMTNYPFTDITEFDDVHAKNIYNVDLASGRESDDIIADLQLNSRDNSRTPMQWDNSENAGFTEGTPWMKVNPNYTMINVQEEERNEHSVLNFYKKMIQFKKSHDIVTYGDFKLVYAEDEHVFAYVRTLNKEKLYVIGNLTDQEVTLQSENIQYNSEDIVLNNYAIEAHNDTSLSLKPFETRVYYVK